MDKKKNKIGDGEFVALMAVVMSLVALAVDSMLPALGQMAISLNVENMNDSQWIISAVFLGMSIGLMIYGPLSDSYGRKKAIYLGIIIFLIGDLVSIYATDLSVMVIGRVIQGFGGAACRVVSVATVRDRFEGPEMGRIMSLILVIFIIVPALAPSVGQAILFFAGWEFIFWFMFVFGLIALTWFHFRQYETLAEENRLPFSLKSILSGARQTIANPMAMGFTVAAGIMFGSFVAYLSSAQQIMQGQYMLGDMFAVYFGVLAFVYGLSSFMNSKLIARLGMERICVIALSLLTLISMGFSLYIVGSGHELSLNLFMLYLLLAFFCLGPLFGNFNSMAMQPFGHIAGIATSVISSIQTLCAVLVGAVVGQLYNGSVLPLIASFMVCGLITLFIFLMAKNQRKRQAQDAT